MRVCFLNLPEGLKRLRDADQDWDQLVRMRVLDR